MKRRDFAEQWARQGAAMKAFGVQQVRCVTVGAAAAAGRLAASAAAAVLFGVLGRSVRPAVSRVEEELRSLKAELEQRILERTRQLEEANRELEAFGYSVSHDLRAPLRVIDGFSAMLLEDYGDKLSSDALDHLRTIRSAAQNMSVLIEDLLRLSRAARGPLNRSRFDLSTVVEEVAADLQRAEPERDVQWLVAPGCEVEADQGLMRVVVQNVLENAWKFTNRVAPGRIEFGAQGEGASRVYYIRDNGAGFDPDCSGELFAPFRRLHAADDYPGTGIGLATVHRIIHRHGGTVRIEGAQGRGATVSFTLGGTG